MKKIILTCLLGLSTTVLADTDEDIFNNAPVVSAENCLTAQGLDSTISKNIVQIVGRTPDGIISGTGWVVKDSGDAVNSYNRVITAKHVIANATEIGVIASNGDFIGVFGVLSKSNTGLKDDNGTVTVTNDLAVLEPTWIAPQQIRRYLSMTGLSLAKYQSPGIMRGYFTDPAGIDHGTSGAPILNLQGNVVGVMTQNAEVVGGALKKVEAYNERWNVNLNKFEVIKVNIDLPKNPTSWGDSLNSDDILMSIGMAGMGIQTQRINEDVIVPGFPERVCVVYKGHMTSK